jgi:ATP-binding cassette subfamily C protein CydC
MKYLLTFRSLFASQIKGFALALVLSLITILSGVALLGTSGWFITATALTTLGVGFNIFVPSSGVRGFSFIRILARYGERMAGHNATLHLLANLRGWLFARLFPRVPIRDKGLRHGDLVSRLTADVDALDTAFLVAIGPIVSAIVVGALVSGFLLWLLPAASWLYATCFLAAVLIVPIGLVLISRQVGQGIVQRSADARTAVLDGIEGHADLTLFGVRGTAHAQFIETSGKLAQSRSRLASLSSIAGFAVQGLAALALAGSLYFGLEALGANRIDGPVLAAIILAIMGSFEATNVVVRSVGKLTTAMAAAERLTALVEAPAAIIESAKPAAWPDTATIEIESLGFHYDGGAPVIADLDLTIPAGEHLAITGASGSGKSSLLALLLRLAEPQLGSITIGSVPLNQMSQADVHAHIALLSQDSPLFNDTIRANLLIADPEASDDALWHALDHAGIGEFVRSLSKQLDTLIGEAGRTVSAGQGRRLCLARVLLSSAQILLLDEPTTGLDRDAEVAFFEALHEAAQGRTVIVVTHAAIPEGTVDRVVSMRNGRLV